MARVGSTTNRHIERLETRRMKFVSRALTAVAAQSVDNPALRCPRPDSYVSIPWQGGRAMQTARRRRDKPAVGTARNNGVQRDEEDCVIVEIPGTLAHVRDSDMAVWLREWTSLLGTPLACSGRASLPVKTSSPEQSTRKSRGCS
jgi:hypothetical protein